MSKATLQSRLMSRDCDGSVAGRSFFRNLSHLIHAIIILHLFAFPAATENLPADIERILNKGTLTIAMYHEDSPPFFMHDATGNFHGFDVELARDAAKRLGVGVEFNRSAKSFDEVVALVNLRQADVAISMLSSTLNRARLVRFTDSYITLNRMLLINRLMLARVKKGGSGQIERFNDPGIKIGVIKGTSYVDFAMEDFPEAQLLYYGDWGTLIKDILDGKITALFYDDLEIKNWIRSNPESALYLQTATVKNKKDHLSFAVHWGNTHLLSWLNMYLRTIKEEGTYDRLIDKYIESGQWKAK